MKSPSNAQSRPGNLKTTLFVGDVRSDPVAPIPAIAARLLFFNSGWMDASPGYGYGGLGMDAMALFQYTLSGCGRLEIGPRKYDLPKGALMMLNLPDRHRHFLPAGGAWEFLFITICGATALDLMRPILQRVGPVVKLRPANQPVQAMWRLHSHAVQGRLADDYLNTLASHQFFIEVTKYFDRCFPIKSTVTLSQAMQVAAGGIHSPVFGVHAWADRVGFARAYFARWMERQTGISPSRQLRMIRMQRAINLLQTTDLPLADIARQIGISGPPVLCRLVRQQYGLTPYALRQLSKDQHALARRGCLASRKR